PIPIITIDGPTASGKGTVAQLVANALHFHYLDSGALYRLTALCALRQRINLDDEAAIAYVAQHLPCRFSDQQIWLADEDVSNAFGEEDIANAPSKFAPFPTVRQAFVLLQKSFAKERGLVEDGRNMGTVIFPQASLKIYLTASVEARAKRRFNQLI